MITLRDYLWKYVHVYCGTHTLTHTHTHIHSHTHTHTLSHTHTHSLTHTLSLSHTHSQAIYADDLSNCSSILETQNAVSSTPVQGRSSEPLNFTVDSLEPFTGYCVRAVGAYRNRTGTREVTRGPGAYIKTDGKTFLTTD